MSGTIGRLREQFQSLFVGPVISDSEPTLCTTCAALDLRKMLRDGLPEARNVLLGTLPDMTKKSDSCSFCRLLVDLIRRRWRLDNFPDADIRGTNFFISASPCGTLIPDLDEKKQAHRLFIHAPRPLDISIALIATKAALELDIQLLEEDCRKVAKSKDLHGRRIKEQVDIRLIKKWIKLCEGAHGETCETVWWKSGHEDLPEFVRMVDVTQMALVGAGHNSRFVALSYVWGGSGDDYWTSTANLAIRNRPSGLRESDLPATIVDAIHLTRQIGERYLWVDALCIIQDSSEDKVAQISIMDRVYGRAALTIIAASGTSVRARLTGIKSGSRMVSQRVECVQGLNLSIPLPPLSEAATDSPWCSRGWTFQEAILARRRLYFTKHQVYFECDRDVWCEDLIAESKTLRGTFHPMRYSRLDPTTFVSYTNVSMNLRSYENVVGQYTQRHLTVDSDIIAAFTALTNAMTRAIEPPGNNPRESFRFGMWIRNLDLALLWQPRFDAIHTRRFAQNAVRPFCPSWAWSGWKGAVHYGVESHMLDGVDSDPHGDPVESLITAWHLVDEDGNIVQLNVRKIPPSWSVEEGTDGHLSPFQYASSQHHPSDTVLSFLPPGGTLVFRTQCARFQVLRLHDDGGSLAETSIKATAHAIFHIIPVDETPPHYAGRIILPVSIPSSSVFEFIVLSRCDGLTGLWDESRWGKRYYGCMLHVMAVQSMLHVMAVQSMREDVRVSERVGLGLIVESAWMESRAEERVVLLA